MSTYPIQPAEAGSGTAAKTSSAAAFALVFGVAALVCVLTAIFAPVGLVLDE